MIINCLLWKQLTDTTGVLLLLLQSALQPLWVLACSTIVEYSQQEGFYRVPLPAARQTLNLEDQWLERSNSRHQVSPTSETTGANPSSGRWNYEREICREFCWKWRLPRHFWVLLHAVNLRHGTEGFTSPSKGIFFARKIRRFRPGLNPRTWVPKASTLTSRPPKPLLVFPCQYHSTNDPYSSINHLTPNGHSMGRTTQLTSRCCILYIYSTNIHTEYFKHAA